MSTTVTLDQSVQVSGKEMARCLARNCDSDERKQFIMDFLGDADDETYAIITQFIRDNPEDA